jgi:hypothetical protein
MTDAKYQRAEALMQRGYTLLDEEEPSEALKLGKIQEFEPESVHSSLEVDEVRVFDEDPEPKGVYDVSGYVFFSED